VTYVPVAFIAMGNYCAGSFFNMLFQLGQEPLRRDKVIALSLIFGVFAMAIGRIWRRAPASKQQT
jgi:hypothetical protein